MKRFLICIGLTAAALAQAQNSVDVRVKVLDPQGRPVPGITVGQMWVAEKSGDPMIPRNGLKTGSDGIASGSQSLSMPTILLMAYDPERGIGGFAAVSAADSGKEVVLNTQPLVPVTLDFEIAGWPGGKSEGFFNVYAFADKNMSLALARPMELRNKLLLPPGKYMIGMFSFDTSSYQKEVVVEAGKPLDLGKAKLEMSAIAKMWGKPAAEITVTDGRGLPKTTKLSDFKGKWVLMEFWGFW